MDALSITAAVVGIGAVEVDGIRPLIHASRRLEYGANINAINSAGQTPLTILVAYNSHNVLRLLLNHWYEYSESPRLPGLHLLQIVALHADLEKIPIHNEGYHHHSPVS